MSASKKRLKTAQINIKTSPTLKEAAEEYAVTENRSLTSLIEHLLTTTLRDKGFLQETAK